MFKTCAQTVCSAWEKAVQGYPQFPQLLRKAFGEQKLSPFWAAYPHKRPQLNPQVLHTISMQLQSVGQQFYPLSTYPITITTMYIKKKKKRD